jgi:flagellar basal-body rod protein FlgB
MRSAFDSVDQLAGVMTFHRQRHAVLSGNLANLDTPGYRPIDLERASPEVAAAPVSRTDPGHQLPPDLGAATQTLRDPAAEPGPDGNAVSLERELAKIDANRVRYATSAELVSRRLALLRYTASDGAA